MFLKIGAIPTTSDEQSTFVLTSRDLPRTRETVELYAHRGEC